MDQQTVGRYSFLSWKTLYKRLTLTKSHRLTERYLLL